jgi:uncharacterized phage protein (TIGR02216 family)
VSEPLAWDAVMGFGFGVLRLSPDAFWRMTLRELAAAVRVVMPDGLDRFGRDGLRALMRRYPD